ncbi:hypothetical protein [Streptomyces gardneri]
MIQQMIDRTDHVGAAEREGWVLLLAVENERAHWQARLGRLHRAVPP